MIFLKLRESASVVCVYKDTLYKGKMGKTYAFYFGLSLNKDNMAKKIKRVFFSKNIKNSPRFRKNMSEEQKKKPSYFL
jgi:hypothetical protein